MMRRLVDLFKRFRSVGLLMLVISVVTFCYFIQISQVLVHRQIEMESSVLSFTPSASVKNQGGISESEVKTNNNNSFYYLKKVPMKHILLWNELFGQMGFMVGSGRHYFIRNRCPVSQCKLYLNPFLIVNRPLDFYDAIVFNVNLITIDSLTELIEKMQVIQGSTTRRPGQRFISFHSEPPAHEQNSFSINDTTAEMVNNFFNWSMSYRLDADIDLFYGSFRPLQKTQRPRPFSALSHKKGKTLNNGSSAVVAWMVTRCSTNSRREDYVKELRKYIDVDVYGKCGELQCKRTNYHLPKPECYDMIESKYKFYLSFENSICTDYVTEKFFRIAQLDSVVPVVYGGADYSRIAPPYSYIDARQFEPKQLADYLKKLDADDALFEEYLQWKDQYIVEASDDSHVRNAFCELCRKLHQDDVSKVETYSQIISHWLQPKKQCLIIDE